MKRRSIFLYPLSLIYGFVTCFRNFLYSANILSSHKFNLPVISVGNITVGGTGKTPHVEYLACLLKERFKVATLSRGYKRNTAGFIIASKSSDVRTIGDEPMQLFRKFPDITVAVDADRVHGINSLLNEKPFISVILLDDAFQHRRVIPGLSILLTDFTRPMSEDCLLPYGNLRESICNIQRADIIIVTKTPENISAIQKKIIEKDICKAPYQELFFTSLKYSIPRPVFIKKAFPGFEKSSAVLVTGIANPEPLLNYLKQFSIQIAHLDFGDHHQYTTDDLEKIRLEWEKLESERKYILTTEKDSVRLREYINIAKPLKSAFYYVPVDIFFLNGEKEKFDKLIVDYVGKNKRNNRLSEI